MVSARDFTSSISSESTNCAYCFSPFKEGTWKNIVLKPLTLTDQIPQGKKRDRLSLFLKKES